MLTSLKSFCAAVALAVATASAASASISVELQGPSVFTGTGYASKFKLQDTPSHSESNVAAGGFALRDTAASGGLGNFIAWCLDIYHYLNIPGTYDITNSPFADRDLSGRVGNIEALFETAFSTISFPDNTKSAGFQLALWELTYETGSTFDLTDGSFTAVPTGTGAAAAITQAKTFLDGLGGTILQSYNLTFLESANGQDLVTATPNLDITSQVPLPAGLMLLLTGLAPFGVAIHRRRRAT